jgi:hypothetical protein
MPAESDAHVDSAACDGRHHGIDAVTTRAAHESEYGSGSSSDCLHPFVPALGAHRDVVVGPILLAMPEPSGGVYRRGQCRFSLFTGAVTPTRANAYSTVPYEQNPC